MIIRLSALEIIVGLLPWHSYFHIDNPELESVPDTNRIWLISTLLNVPSRENLRMPLDSGLNDVKITGFSPGKFGVFASTGMVKL